MFQTTIPDKIVPGSIRWSQTWETTKFGPVRTQDLFEGSCYIYFSGLARPAVNATWTHISDGLLDLVARFVAASLMITP